MGLNISGLVIDKNYKNNLTELESVFEQKMIFEKEVDYEDAIENWKEEDYCDIFYSKNGTIIMLSMITGGFDFNVKDQTAFSFVLSEMTGMYCVNYTQNEELIRSIMETQEEYEEDGEPLDFESEDTSLEEFIYHLIEKTLGESFYNIPVDAKWERYSFQIMEDSDEGINEVNEEEEVDDDDEVEDYSFNSYPETEPNLHVPSQYESPKKPWWKFW